MNKRGQFYLIAAVIIIAMIIGFVAVKNYSSDRRDVKIYDLADELNIESEKVLDFGTYNEAEINQTALMDHFTNVYSNYIVESGQETPTIYYIFGNELGVYGYSYEELVSGTITVSIGGDVSTFIISARQKNELENIEILNDKIIVHVEGTDYEFDLKEGENFYFVLTQEINGEDHTISE